ncbi:hypothetical protein [Variovorax saccharolyticus]|uniref:hypothetical protein n=1 Tax=Variovorax saccharolyticus TaxID=3053516 RepID=UPI002574F6BE|nr:hypothetical protein [Variovorax sp. J31P216]MDM0029641.1 hypothetical protein [Variovorax sp. J31P216]
MAYDDHRGILTQIRGMYIAAAQNTLPPAGPDQPEVLTADIEVPNFGRLRITFERMSHLHGRVRTWFWTAVFAEVVPAA